MRGFERYQEAARKAFGLRRPPSSAERRRAQEIARAALHQRWLPAPIVTPVALPEHALLLGTHPETGEPVYLLPEQLATHLHVIGASGKGKSNFLRRLIEQLFAHHRRTGEGLAIIDPHGSLAEFALALAIGRGPEFASRVTYFDLLRSGRVPVFNPLRAQYGVAYSANCFVEAMAKVFGHANSTEQPLVAEVVEKTAAVLMLNGLSPAEAHFFLESTPQNLAVRQALLRAIPESERHLRGFWERMGEHRPGEFDERAGGARRRFEHLIKSPTLRRIVSQTGAGVELREAMDSGGIVIFNLAREGTDVTLDQQALLGSLLIQEFRNVTERRTPDASLPFTLIVDEFGDFVSPDAMRIFTGARKFGLRCVFAHQDLHQLQLKNNDFRLHAAALAVENKAIFGGGTTDDQLTLAREAYGNYVDTEERKLELYSRCFEPRPTKVTLRSGGESVTAAVQSARNSSRSSQQRATGQPIETESEGESGGESASYASNSGWSEAWVTFVREFRQLSSVQFRTIEEQIFAHQQNLRRQATGRCVIVTGRGAPTPCVIPHMALPTLSAQEREAFLALVFAKPMYLRPEDADRAIHERAMRLIGAAGAGSATAKKSQFRPTVRKN